MVGNGIAHRDANATAVVASEPAPLADTPDDLAGLIASWRNLPENIGSAIAALANA